MSKHQVELCNWSAVKSANGSEVFLRGTVLNHPTLPDYTKVDKTSALQVICREDGRYVAITKSGTHYRLGTTDPGWVERHPTARSSVIDHFHLTINLEALESGVSAY